MIPILILAAIYAALVVILLRPRARRGPVQGWMLSYSGFSVALAVTHALILGDRITLPPPLSAPFLVLVGFVAGTSLIMLLTLAYLDYPSKPRLIAGGALVVWVGVTAVLALLGVPPLADPQGWLLRTFGDAITLGTEVAALGWVLITIALIVLTWRRFLHELLPLYANRILFWAVLVPAMLFGEALVGAWLAQPWPYMGHGIRLAGAAAATYAVAAYRVVDIRDTIRWAVSRTILLLVAAALVVGGIMAADYARIPNLNTLGRWVVTVGIGLLVALLLQPIMRLGRWLLRRWIVRSAADPAEAVRLYSQQIDGVVDLDELGQRAITTLNLLLATRKSLLILATQEDGRIALQEVGTARASLSLPGMLSAESPLYQRFVASRRPVPQYDIDYDGRYAEVPEPERQYLANLEMDVFAPIVSNDRLIGLLALGPKINDDPFRPNEIRLLEALASQTVVALENARLVTDLRNLNQEISVLVEDLRTSNERIERLDDVKSDFITIASHELRTPLTQIQGFSGLLHEMTERRTYDPDEIIELTDSLSKATQRMTEVISAMLDVSQIDVENMDLNFVEVMLPSVLKLAIEPYAEAIQQRHQVLVARGLTGLPPVKADYRRLVQAFQNLITNAIKFTPDGGKINVVGQVYGKDDEGNPLSVRITIEDSGIGIDKEHHELVFDKFYRIGSVALHSTGITKFKGAGPGLGLAIAKGIVEGHGGRIWVESPGHDEEKMPGSRFHVVLPVTPPSIEARRRMDEMRALRAYELDSTGPSE